MKQINTKVSRGEVILFSNGEYSDYAYCGEVIFTKDCDLAEQVQKYRAATNPESKDYRDEIYGFAGWLVGKEYCLPLECREIHLGGYNNFSPDFLTARQESV